MKSIDRLALAAVVVVSIACGGGQKQETPSTAQASAKAGFTPPKQYPEWSLEDQETAMKAVEEQRRKTRIEGLRAKTPPADWIATAYHGLVLDANYEEIELDPHTVTRMQESLFTILYDQTRDAALRKLGQDVDFKQLFFGEKLDEKVRLIVRSAVLDEMLDLSDQIVRDRYDWRHDLMRRGANSAFDWTATTIHPDVLELMRRYGLRLTPPNPRGTEYVEACRAQEVPIPPDWPDRRWVHQGRLAFTFISLDRTADVYTYKDLDVPGVCYALPRRDAAGIGLLSIACQSKRTGKACFWDNRTISDALITPVGRLEIHNIGNGNTLGENCTSCHRGFNAFNIHPGTALDLTRKLVVRAPYDPDTTGFPAWHTNPDRRYSPIGRPAFANPPALDATVLPLPPPLLNGSLPSCTLCHEIPQTRDSSFCRDVLAQAMTITMPPPSPRWTRADFSDHINRLRSCP